MPSKSYRCNKKRPYMRLFTADYRDGTRDLTFEQQGFYMRILTLLHDGEDVPADVKKLAIKLQCDPRMSKRLLKPLIDAEKLQIDDADCLRNNRVDTDQEKYISETSHKHQPDISEKFPELPPDVSETSPRNTQKRERNQGVKSTGNPKPEAIAISHNQSSRSLERVSDEQEAIGGLNGSTSMIITKFATWINPHAPDFKTAREAVSNAVGIYGDVAVRDGVAEFNADMLDGKIRIPTTKVLYGYIRQAKDRVPKQRLNTKQAQRSALADEQLKMVKELTA